MQLQGRVAIITGASAGIGEALARLLVAEGARVALAARSEEKLRQLAAELGEAQAFAVPTDVADAAQVERLMARTVERFEGIDLLINNAGVGLYSLIPEMDWEHFRRMWEVNFFAAVRCTLAALPHLQKRRGTVVNISSVAGKVVLPYMGGYCATKFALNVFSDAFRMESARHGVRVVTVCPGRVRTEFHLTAYRDGQNLPRVMKNRTTYAGILPERVARATLRAVRWNRREVVVPWPLRFVTGFRRLFPGLTDWALSRVVR